MTALAAHILECTPTRVASAKRHASKSVQFIELRKMRLLPETRVGLNRAAQKTCPCCLDEDCGKRAGRLPAACHDVYAAIRTATARGYAGAVVSGNELAKLLAVAPRTVWYAIRKLRALKLLQRITQFESRAYTCVKTGKLYGRIKAKSSYLLGPSAPPVRVRPPRAKVAVPPLLQKMRIQPSLWSGEGVCSASPPTQGVEANASQRGGPKGPGACGPNGSADRAVAPLGGAVHTDKLCVPARSLSSDEIALLRQDLAGLDLSFFSDGGSVPSAADKKGGAQ